MNLPADWDWSTLPEDFALRHAAERDLAAILTCDSIHLLPGWQESKGARAERAVAEWIGLGVFEYVPPISIYVCDKCGAETKFLDLCFCTGFCECECDDECDHGICGACKTEIGGVKNG